LPAILDFNKSSRLTVELLLLLRWINADKTPPAPSVFEFNDAGDLGVKSIVTADADVGAGFEFRAALANQDGAAQNRLAAEALDSQALSRRIAPVARAAYTFLMSHIKNRYLSCRDIKRSIRSLSR
jgi:hypothetical protein